ncbi:MAG TPA: DUF1697 domain-containing protein [Streptosporangiaceae bacterium]|nr:DUF1697 domain-containing protein [Streptosporangiaceae bacterium]
MATHVALLRGINVGGRNKIAMADLRAAVASLGYDSVSTYIQSGNVLFSTGQASTGQASTAQIENAVRDVIGTSFGLTIGVIVLTRDELAAVISRNPYPDEPDPRRVHVVFLRTEPDEAVLARLAATCEGTRDSVTATGRALYLHTPDGFGTSELAKSSAKPAINGTARNWATTTKLLTLCD